MPSAAKTKKGARGVKIPIASLLERENSLDWARDELNTAAENPSDPTTGTAVEAPPRRFGYQAGSMPTNFRESAPTVPRTVVPTDMMPPFLAYVGNVAHGVLAEAISASFTGVVNSRVVRTDTATFAYVEFASVEELQACVLSSGKFLAGRRAKIDVASDAQRKRYGKEQRQNEARSASRNTSTTLSRTSSLNDILPLSDASDESAGPTVQMPLSHIAPPFAPRRSSVDASSASSASSVASRSPGPRLARGSQRARADFSSFRNSEPLSQPPLPVLASDVQTPTRPTHPGPT